MTVPRGAARGRPTAVCEHCGARFELPPRRGPRPRYCSPAHKQRAYEARRAGAARDEREAQESEVRALRRRNARLERENRILREDLEDLRAQLRRVSPPPAHLAHLIDYDPRPPAPVPTPSRRRRQR